MWNQSRIRWALAVIICEIGYELCGQKSCEFAKDINPKYYKNGNESYTFFVLGRLGCTENYGNFANVFYFWG